jgi:hypothetical protein
MPNDTDSPGAPFALEDRSDCRDLIASYAPAVDWIDASTLLRIFWPAATVDLGPGFYKGPVEGYVETVIEQIEAAFLRRMHNPGFPQVNVNGDRAEAEHAAVNQTLSRDASGAITLSTYTGRYLWKLERRIGRWGISSMMFLLVSAQHTPYDPGGEFPGLNLAEKLDIRTKFFG